VKPGTCLDAGVTFIDTIDVYGSGESERIIGRLMAEDCAANRATTPLIATKFLPAPWKVNVKSALLRSLRASVERLRVEKVELYQIHGPISLRGHGALADALAAGHEAGLLDAVGVSNYSIKEMRTDKSERPARRGDQHDRRVRITGIPDGSARARRVARRARRARLALAWRSIQCGGRHAATTTPSSAAAVTRA